MRRVCLFDCEQGHISLALVRSMNKVVLVVDRKIEGNTNHRWSKSIIYQWPVKSQANMGTIESDFSTYHFDGTLNTLSDNISWLHLTLINQMMAHQLWGMEQFGIGQRLIVENHRQLLWMLTGLVRELLVDGSDIRRKWKRLTAVQVS